jgi:hypothetical protein
MYDDPPRPRWQRVLLYIVGFLGLLFLYLFGSQFI